MNYLITILGRALFLVAIMPIHEYAHGWMAEKMGDSTARYSGRLDMNPFKHLDPIGSVMILLTGFGWAKPVPINSNNFYDRKKGTFLTAFAGPAANILLSLVTIIISKLLMRFGYYGIIVVILNIIMQTSVYLAVFNLLPVPPLDGWNMFSMFLPHNVYYKIISHEREISLIFLVLIMTRILTYPLVFISSFIIKFLNLITFFI